jgi:fucokinase
MPTDDIESFPFTTVIVTNPDEASAKSAQQLLDSTLKNHLRKQYPQQSIRFLSTYDPFGARCGSFGGTLAAVDLIRENNDGDLQNETILCLHAGGDSSRCPLSMILGKAWQELPSKQYRNPTFWLIHQLEDLFRLANIPKGSLLVAATDCLISLGTSTTMQNFKTASIDDTNSPWTVIGVAVPAPINTAKNHGVFVMSEAVTSMPGVQIDDPVDVWQKPSVDQLEGNCNDTPASFDASGRAGKQAWIDVGIVIFYPKAVETLVGLSEGLLSKCTRRGLELSYQQSADVESQSLEAFAKKSALKVDLYTDILHNIPRTNKAIQRTNGDKTSMTAALQNGLSKLLLKVLVLPKGTFLHLGTTTELIEFITFGSHPFDESLQTKAVDKAVTQELATSLQLHPRFRTWSAPEPDDRNVTLCCIFPSGNDNTTLGSSTLVEYSDLQGFESVSVGDHCMLSGWRTASVEASHEQTRQSCELNIPDRLSVQLLSLAHGRVVAPGDFVLLVLGTDDSIKAPIQQSTIYGVSLDDVIASTGISLWQLGLDEMLDENDCVWTIKIHPIVNDKSTFTSFGDYFSWIEKLRTGTKDLQNDPSFARWLHAPRFSLQDLHTVADAGKEWKFRNTLERRIWKLQSEKEIQDIEKHLAERCHNVPCNMGWLLEMEDSNLSFAALCRLVSKLELLAMKALTEKNYDISGRALMLASATMADFITHEGVTDVTPMNVPSTQCHSLLEKLKMSSTRRLPDTAIINAVDKILKTVKTCMQDNKPASLQFCSEVLELVAFRMTEFTVSDGFRGFLDPEESETIRFCRTNEVSLSNRWVISTAPARVDLAGGWSDTPPICYEYGGSVTGMAVLVDKYYPLSCRCRVTLGATGILLRSEMRDISSGALLSHQQDEIHTLSDIKGFRDPSAACALLKAALLCLGMVTEEQIKQSSAELQPLLNAFCSTHDNVRLEIVTTSLLGLGTGMGTSSILGSCILQTVAKTVGIGNLDKEALLHAVLMLEQILSSGGGWQDQAHGIFPGVKTVRSKPPQIPMSIKVEPLELCDDKVALFEDRLMFAYTGQTRLAKGILQQVLRRWSRRTCEIVHTVESLVKYSESVRQGYLNEDWNDVGQAMQNGYRLKCLMAGEESGAEPESVKVFISMLTKAGLIEGAMLCGAGGGGFLLLVRSENVIEEQIVDFFTSEIAPLRKDFESFSFHHCHIARKGLTTSLMDDSEIDSESFELSWHRR